MKFRTRLGPSLTGSGCCKLQNAGLTGGHLNYDHSEKRLTNSLLEKVAKRHKYDGNLQNKINVLLETHSAFSKTLMSPTSIISEPLVKRVKFDIEEDFAMKSTEDDENNFTSKTGFPEYSFKQDEMKEWEKNVFRSTDADISKNLKYKEKLSQKQSKISLINAVSISLVRGPNLKNPKDPQRLALIQHCDIVSKFDPEFILKVALYSRQELNIRTTTNVLLAYAAFDPNCRPFLKRYFNKSVVLPSDWLDVAEQYQYFDDKKINFGSLPTALRKVLFAKFSTFNVYQLAKYNKTKKKKKQKPVVKTDEMVVPDEAEESEEEVQRRTFTLKRLIRLLHIGEPAEYVMGLIGKRYPQDVNTFRESKLQGTWEESKAGQRMKLPTPITWETQLSAKGNNAKTWEELISSRKLPYMAMLRNLRNIILAGVSEKHHSMVIKNIADKNAVVRSRLFPHQFAAAQEVLAELETNMYSKRLTSKQRWKSSSDWKNLDAIQRKKYLLKIEAQRKGESFSAELFRRYNKALIAAMSTAAFFNISPIHGTTLILLDVTSYMNESCSTAKGLGKSRTILEMARLLNNLCSKACEVCTIQEFTTEESQNDSPLPSEKLITKIDESLFTQLVTDRQKLDNVIVLTSKKEIPVISHFVSKSRLHGNPDLLYVTVCLAGSTVRASTEAHQENDVRLVGFTDGILRFIAERGKGGQLGFVESIDEKYCLEPLPRRILGRSGDVITQMPHGVENIVTSNWQTVKVFISSTFLDMNSERDILIKYIFPELRYRARNLNIDLRDVDLRWGITEAESNSDKLLEICLNEVSKCQLFIGILGERYGYVPESYEIAEKNPDLQWLRKYPKGASLTELEFHLAALAHPDEAKERAFFYIRSSSVYRSIPKQYLSDYVEDSLENREKLDKLKAKLCSSGLEVFNGYPSSVGQSVSGAPVITGLHEFGKRVLDNLWVALQKIHAKSNDRNLQIGDSSLHSSFVANENEKFIGRTNLVSGCIQSIIGTKQGLIIIHGKQGSGKTALMAHLIHMLTGEKIGRCSPIIFYFVGATSTSGFALSILRYLAEQMSEKTVCDYEFSSELSNSVEEFKNVLIEASKIVDRVFIFIDGLDVLENDQQAKIVDCLRANLPKGVTVVCTATTNSSLYKGFVGVPPAKSILMGPMGIADKMQVIRNNFLAHGKTLDESSFNNQLNMLALKQGSCLPLFLSLACEELRTFGDFNKLSEKIKSLSSTIDGLIQNILERIEVDHSLKLTAGVMGFLSICQDGVHEEDLHILLSIYLCHFGEISTVQDARKLTCDWAEALPRVRFFQLVRSIRCLLQATIHSSDRILKFGFSNVVSAVEARYKQSTLSTAGKLQLHNITALYYWKLANPENDGNNWSACIPRALAFLPRHLLLGGSLKELTGLLSNLTFIRAKIEAGLVNQLLNDYRTVEVFFGLSKSKIMGSSLRQTLVEALQSYESFVAKYLHILKACPQLIVQQAYNEPDGFITASDAKKAANDLYHTIPPLINWVNKPQTEDPCLSTIELTMPASCVAFSPDEKYIAVGDSNNIHLYDVVTSTKFASFIGHDSKLTSLLFIGRNKLCSADNGGTISIWNVEQKYRLHVLKTHTRQVPSLCCDPAGLCLVSVGWDGAIALWKVNSGEEEKIISPDKNWSPINCVAFHPVKQMIVAGSWDKTLKIWCLLSYQCKAIFRGHTASVCSVSITPNGKSVLSTSLDRTLRIWSFSKGFQIANISNTFPFTSSCFSSSGNHILAACADKTIKIFSSSVSQTVSFVKGIRNVASTGLLLNSETVVTGYEDGCVLSRNYKTDDTGCLFNCGESAVTCLVWCHLSSRIKNVKLIVGLQNGSVKLLNFQEMKIEKDLLGHKSAITSLACSPILIVSGSCGGNIAAHFKPWRNSDYAVSPSFIIPAHNGSVTGISFSWNYSSFATVGNDRVLKTWPAFSFTSTEVEISNCTSIDPELELFGCHDGAITACCWAENSKLEIPLVITAGTDLTVCAWNTITGDRVWIKKNMNAPVTYLMCLRKHMLIGCSIDGTIYTWSPSGIEIHQISGKGESLFAVYSDLQSVSNDWYKMAVDEMNDKEKGTTATQVLQTLSSDLGNVFIAKAGPVGDISIIKPSLENATEILVGHSESVVSIASSIGDKLVSSSLDGTVKVWKPKCYAECQQEMNADPSHSIGVTCITRATCNAILSGDRDGYIIVWYEYKNNWRPMIKTKSHKKSVTVLLTLPHETGLIASASNDGVLSIWKLSFITPQKMQPHEMSLLKEEEMEVDVLPLISLNLEVSETFPSPIITATQHNQGNSMLIGLSSEHLYSVDVKFHHHMHKWLLNTKKMDYSHACVNLIRPWTTLLKQIHSKREGDSLVLSVNSLGEVALWKLNCEHKQDFLFTGNISCILGKRGFASLTCHRDTWINAVEAFEVTEDPSTLKVLAGLASGEVISFSLICPNAGEKYEVSDVTSNKLHSGSVVGVTLCIQPSNGMYIICTGGEDAVLKLWEVSSSNDYKQIAQFYCKSTVTCTLTPQFNQFSGEIEIFCGDAHGNVYMLAVKI